MTIANLGDAKGRIILDASGVQAGIDEARRTLTDGLRGIGDSLTDVGKSLSILTAPIMLFGALGVRAAADFDAAMRELSARTGIVGDDLERMKQAAIDMGAATVFSASDAANALLQLTSSGMTADEALQVLPAVMYGAAAAGTSLGDTADWVTDILAQFGLEASDATGVMDALVQASGSGSATVMDLALGFQNAGSIASLFGLSVYDVAATLQVFSENGIKGAEAGTQLKSMLTNMSRQTPDTIAAWNELGVSLYDASGNMRELDAVIDDLNAAMAGMTQEERISYIQRLAGAYGQAGLAALLASGGIDEMQASMEGAAGAIDVANSRMEGWNGMIETVRGSIETLMITVLLPFMNDYLVPLGLNLADVVSYITAWAEKNPELTSTLVLILTVLAALGPAMVVMGTIITNTSTVFGAMGAAAKLLGAAIGGISWPVLLIIAAVGALAAAWSTNFLGIRDTVMGVVDEIVPKLQAIYDALKNGDVEGAIGKVGELVDGAKNAIGTALPEVQAKLAEWASAFVDWIAPQIPIILAELGTLATDLLNWVGEQALVIGEKLLEWAGAFGGWVLQASADLLLALPGILADLLKWILDVTPDITAQILLWSAEFVNWIGPVAADMVVKLGEIITAVTNWILTEFIPAIIAEAPGIVDALLKFVSDTVAKVPSAMLEFLTAVRNYIINDMTPALATAAIDLGKAILDGIINGLAALARELARIIDEALPDSVDFGSFHVPDLGPFGGGYDVTLGLDLPDNPIQSLMGIMDEGGKGLADVPYFIGRGAQPELFVPDSPGTFYPRGQYPEELLNGGDTYQIYVEVPPILLKQEPEIEDNARLFGERLAAALQAMG